MDLHQTSSKDSNIVPLIDRLLLSHTSHKELLTMSTSYKNGGGGMGHAENNIKVSRFTFIDTLLEQPQLVMKRRIAL
jgi:hypothetical protein